MPLMTACSEKMPEDKQRCYIQHVDGDQYLAQWNAGMEPWGWATRDLKWFKIADVTHWYPCADFHTEAKGTAKVVLRHDDPRLARPFVGYAFCKKKDGGIEDDEDWNGPYRLTKAEALADGRAAARALGYRVEEMKGNR